jgi:spore coat polysaccharide biosynthesis predicted glycosyltransferase SpsG
MLGLPSVLLVVAVNQEPVARELSGMGIAIDASSWAGRERLGASVRELLLSSVRRREMSQRGCELVDGRGAERVVRAMRDFGRRTESGSNELVARRRAAGTGVAV